MADLSLADEVCHGADGVLDRCRGIDPVLVIEVDDVRAEAPQARLAAGADVFGLPVDTQPAPVLPADVSELGRQDGLGAAVPDCLADELLVPAEPVDVGR